MKKSLLAVVGGFVTTIVVVAIFDVLNYSVFPPPGHLDPTSKEDLAEIIRLAPSLAWVLLLVGHIVGSIAGGYVAGKISTGSRRWVAIVCGVLMIVVATINNFAVGSTPMWFWIVDLMLYIPFCLLGYLLARGSQLSKSNE